VAPLHGVRAGTQVAVRAELVGVTDDHAQARQVGQRGRTIAQRLRTGLHEGRPQQQVLGRIAAQAEFGGQYQTGPKGMGSTREFDDAPGIAVQVADRGIDLRKSHFHRGRG